MASCEDCMSFRLCSLCGFLKSSYRKYCEPCGFFLNRADYVKVVRCKDCKYRYSSEFCECRPEDAYCSDGERKENK